MLIALWALVSAFAVPALAAMAPGLMGASGSGWRYWAVAFTLPLVALLPATMAMGATLAAAERWYAQITTRRDQLPRLYALNTLGAAAGPLLTTAVLIPAMGFSRALLALALVNLLVAATAFRLAGTASPAVQLPEQADMRPPGSAGLALRLFVTGCLGVGFELLAIRAMAQVFEGTVYSHAAALCVYLLATAVGAGLYQRFAHRLPGPRRAGLLCIAVSLACLLGTAALFTSADLYRALRLALGDTPPAVMAAELCLAIPALFLPAMAMGALFACLATAARHARGGIGWAFGINTLGALLAAPLVAVLMVPALGLKASATVIALAYLLLLPAGSRLPRWVPAVPVIAALLLPDSLRIVTLRDDERLLAYREGAMASVAVTERPGERNLRVNNRFQMGGTGRRAVRIQRMQAHVPLLRHPAPASVLFLGVASGVTTGAALAHGEVRVDAVELVPEGLAVLEHFAPQNRSLQDDARVSLHSADARRFVRASSGRWDVIIGDLFHPARDGAALLYTAEHFTAVRQRLAPGGLFCQWLPVYQLDADMLRIIVRSFLQAFPDAELWFGGFDTAYPVLGLVGADALPGFSAADFQARVGKLPLLGADLRAAAAGEPVQFVGHHLADRGVLTAWAGSGPLNTDDHPRTLFDAARFTYQRGLAPWRSLRELHAGLPTATPADSVVAAALPPSGRERLDAFRAARDAYLQAQMTAADDAERVPAFTRIAALSGDFSFAYAHAASIAMAHARTRPEEAMQWLRALVRARPDNPVAGRLLARLARARPRGAAPGSGSGRQ